MARLKLHFLGPFQVTYDDKAILDFESDKERALLSYLAIESRRPVPRESIAETLWPERPEGDARRNLRHSLMSLRKTIRDYDAKPPFLNITRKTIAFNQDSDHWLDVKEFTADIVGFREEKLGGTGQLEKAISLYRGKFLEDLTIQGSTEFQEWVLVTREHLSRLVIDAIRRMVAYHEGRGEYTRGRRLAQRWVEIEPWDEEGHHQLIRLLALNGQRSAALSQYETCCKALESELGVRPSEATKTLYDQILKGGFERDAADPREWVIRGFELLEQIGAGTFGRVYKAHQPLVNREVAIKIIPSQYADQPEFIRRFEQEAQLAARLEHPHIIPLYDYWREPGRAYLVMRWLNGGSLADVKNRKKWHLDRLAQLISQVASALTAAHQQGVAHGNLKTSNVLLDEGENAYLSDFRLGALIQSTRVPGRKGEDLSQKAELSSTAPQIDIRNLGMLLYDLLVSGYSPQLLSDAELRESNSSDSVPSACSIRPDLPPEVDTVIERAMARHPEDPFPDAMALANAFQQALLPGFKKTAKIPEFKEEIRNPYKGLRPFEEADAEDFFGRQDLVDRMVERLREENEASGFLAIVGPSGSGKSSAVKAGLMPALRRGVLPGVESWFIIDITPGKHPFEALTKALLGIAVDPPENLSGLLQEDERGFLNVFGLILPDESSQLILIIDQFEELFTLVENELERAQFFASLRELVRESNGRFRAVITLRADYYDRPLMYPEFGELIRNSTEVILPLSPMELERAITGPAERVGITIEPSLVAAIVSEVSEQPGSLPLLQFALTELFERRVGRTFTLDAYQQSGGVSGALVRRAEELFIDLDPSAQEATRQLFLHLVNIGVGVEAARIRVPRRSLISLVDDRSVMDAVIDVYGRYRLLTFDHDPETREPTVEVAHEALIREWKRLQSWIDSSKEDILIQSRLAAAAHEWVAEGRQNGYLIRGARLEQFETWTNETDIALTHVERAFLDASLEERHKRQEAEAARKEREKTLERRSRNFLRTLVGVLASATLVAGVLSIIAFNQRGIAQREARISTARELAAAAINNLDSDPERSILLALQAVDTTYGIDGDALKEAQEALHRAINSSRVRLTIQLEDDPILQFVEFSPDGTRLVSWSFTDWEAFPLVPGKTRIWDARSGELIHTLPGFRAADTWPDGTLMATIIPSQFGAQHAFWDAETGAKISSLSLSPPGIPFSSNFDPTWQLNAFSLQSGTIPIFDLGTEALIMSLGTTGSPPALSVVFSNHGNLLASGDLSGDVQIWDLNSGKQLHSLPGHQGDISELIFSADDTRLVSASVDGTAIVWDTYSGEKLVTLTGHTNELLGLALSRDNEYAATTSWDRKVKIWDLPESIKTGTGQELFTLAGHTEAVEDAAISPDGTRLASVSWDGQIKIWDITPAGAAEGPVFIHADNVSNEWIVSLALSPDGEKLVTVMDDLTPRIWDTKTGGLLHSLSGHGEHVLTTAISPDGKVVLTRSYDPDGDYSNQIKAWDIYTGDEIFSIPDSGHDVSELDFSPDGKLIAVGNMNGDISIIDFETLLASGGELSSQDQIRLRAGIAKDYLIGVDFDPTGNKIVTSMSGYQAGIWNVETGELMETLIGHTASVHSVAYSADGNRIATSSADGTGIIWDAESGQPLLTLTGHTSSVISITFSPDGARLATAGNDGTARIWNSESGEELLTLYGHRSGVTDVEFSPDGDLLYTASLDGTARVHILDLDTLIALAKKRITRSFTVEECEKYLHNERCPPMP